MIKKMKHFKLMLLAGVSFTLFSCDKMIAPEVTLNVDQTTASVGDAININVTASDDKKIERYNMEINMYASDSTQMEHNEVYEDNSYNSASLTLTHQYTIPATSNSGDSLQPGDYISVWMQVTDNKSNTTTISKQILIQ